MNVKLIISAIAGTLLVGACADSDTDAKMQVANPASVYCIDQGGELLIKTGENGQYGICKLPDGREIEEWELYRQNNPG